jgi:hypothetical protein
MEPGHLAEVRAHWADQAHKVRVLGVPDDYDPDEPELRSLLMGKIRELLNPSGPGGAAARTRRGR